MSIIERAVNRISRDAAKESGARTDADAPARLKPLSESDEQSATDMAPPAPETTRNYQDIDLGRLRREGIVTPDNGRSSIAEEFRLIKRPLLDNMSGGRRGEVRRNGNLIMVTSSLPKEGKTFCSVSLAMSIAMEVDRTVLLVDADVARPRVPSALGVKVEKGLLDLLRDDQLRLSDVLIRTNVPNLTLLPAGSTYDRANEVLASEAMHRLVEDIASRYSDRVVIFDTPPLLATSEASVLAGYMGQVVMVVECEKTPQGAVMRSMELLEHCPLVMTMLNKTDPLPGLGYSQSYYGNYAKA